MTGPEAGVRLYRLRRSVDAVRDLRADPPAVGLVLEGGGVRFAPIDGDAVDIAIRDLPLGNGNGNGNGNGHGHGSAASSPPSGRLLLTEAFGVTLAALEGLPGGHDDGTRARRTDSIRLLRLLGAETLIVCGRCLPLRGAAFSEGLFLVADHLNLTGTNPLVGPNEESIGPRFPDMTDAYDRKLRQAARAAAEAQGIPLPEVVYAGVAGPGTPTAAELERYASLGADVVGPGVVADTIVARHAGMRVLAIAAPDARWEDLLPRHGDPRPNDAPSDLHSGTRVSDLLGHILRTLRDPT